MPLIILFALAIVGGASFLSVSEHGAPLTLTAPSHAVVGFSEAQNEEFSVAPIPSSKQSHSEAGSNSLITRVTTEAPMAVIDATSPVLYVSAHAQPASSLLPQEALGVPLTQVTLTAGSEDVEVSAVTIKLRGFGHRNIFEGVAIVNEAGEEFGDEKLFRSDNTAVIKGGLTIPAGESTVLTIIGNISEDLDEYDGQMPILAFENIETTSAIVGTLPIVGNPHTVNTTLRLGSATTELSQFDPMTSRTQYINDTGVRFAGIRITAGVQENLQLKSITWEQSGTAGAEDLRNVVVIANGIPYPTEEDDRSYSANFGEGILISKGSTIDVYVQSDITTSGSNRTIVFEIGAPDDIELVGGQYGFTISNITAAGNTATSGGSVFITSDGTTEGEPGEPFFAGSEFTIRGGAVTSIGKN